MADPIRGGRTCEPDPADPTKIKCTGPKPSDPGWTDDQSWYRLSFEGIGAAVGVGTRFMAYKIDHSLLQPVHQIPGLPNEQGAADKNYFQVSALSSASYQLSLHELPQKTGNLVDGVTAGVAAGVAVYGATHNNSAMMVNGLFQLGDAAVSLTQRNFADNWKFETGQTAIAVAGAVGSFLLCSTNPDTPSPNKTVGPDWEPANPYDPIPGGNPYTKHDRYAGARNCRELQTFFVNEAAAGVSKLAVRGVKQVPGLVKRAWRAVTR